MGLSISFGVGVDTSINSYMPITFNINPLSPLIANWTGTKNGIPLPNNILYKLTSVIVEELPSVPEGNNSSQTATHGVVSPARIKVSDMVLPTPYHRRTEIRSPEEFNSNTVVTRGKLFPTFKSIFNFENIITEPIWAEMGEYLEYAPNNNWVFLPPPAINDSPPDPTLSKDVGTFIYLACNPYTGNEYFVEKSQKTWSGPGKNLGVRIDTFRDGGFTVPFRITTTWTYVSGDDDIISTEFNTIQTSQEGYYTSKAPPISYDGDSSRGSSSGGNGEDPLAQSFFVNSNTNPNGIFAKSIDLFFKTKSSTAPVEVQIRPVVNGYPSSSVILPFASIVKPANEILISEDATVATNFEFGNIIHLSPGEYAFVVLTNTDEYQLYSSKIGEFQLNTTERVTTQPLLGSLFKSQNSTAWTAEQEEDLKFRLYNAVFRNVTGTALLDTKLSPNYGDIEYETFYTGGEVLNFSATEMTHEFKTSKKFTSDLGEISLVADNLIPYQLGANVNLTETKSIFDVEPTSLQFKSTLSTDDGNVTPVIDLNRLSSVLVKNIINNSAVGETDPFKGSAFAKYITRSVKLNPGFDSTDIKVFFSANIPSGTSVKVYYKISAYYDTVFDDNEYTEMVLDFTSGWKENKYTEYKYKTPFLNGTGPDALTQAFSTGEKFDTFSIKVVMLSNNPAYVPLIKDLRVIALDE